MDIYIVTNKYYKSLKLCRIEFDFTADNLAHCGLQQCQIIGLYIVSLMQ